MVQVKVEHVIVVLLGLFLLYHFMGSCGCNKVEGWLTGGENYKYQKPYVQEDSSYCGISEDYDQYYRDSFALNNLAETSNLYALIQNHALAKTALDKANDDLTQATADSAETTLIYQAHQAIPQPSPGIELERWKRTDASNEAEYQSDLQSLAAVTTAQAIAQAAYDTQNTELTTETQNFQDTLTTKYNIRKRLCDKPNRMLDKYGPEHACVGDPGKVLGPDMRFWKDTEVKKFMKYDRGGDAETNIDGDIPSCEVKISTGKDNTLTDPDGPFHGYTFDPEAARYEFAPWHKENNTANPTSYLGLF